MDHQNNRFVPEEKAEPHWDKFEIGEEITIKKHIYRVVDIEEKRLILEPVRPTDKFFQDKMRAEANMLKQSVNNQTDDMRDFVANKYPKKNR